VKAIIAGTGGELLVPYQMKSVSIVAGLPGASNIAGQPYPNFCSWWEADIQSSQ
jgi:hypothetical protein